MGVWKGPVKGPAFEVGQDPRPAFAPGAVRANARPRYILGWMKTPSLPGDAETVVLAFPDLYGRLVGKRFTASFFEEAVRSRGTHACDYLFAVDMEMNPVPGYAFANWERGFGDVHLVPDLATLRPAAWLEKTAFVLADVHDRAGRPVEMAPRQVLKRALAYARRLGFRVRAASELEFYLFETPYREAARRGYRGLEPAGHYLEDYHVFQGSRHEPLLAELRRALLASNIPVESTKGEWGVGQHEVNLRHAEALEAADRHLLLKEALKTLADRMGKSVTFMAKPFGGQAGSSGHVHLSLWQEERPAFAGDEAFGPVRGSRVFGAFLAGLLKYARDFMVFFAPTVNSYKRYEDGSWAPTRIAWSFDNRTAGFRVVGAGESLRVENRIPGADTNPYLAYAAMLFAGLRGVEESLAPPPPFEGNVYQAEALPRVPYTLEEATREFAKSSLAREVLGEGVHDHYRRFFESEWAAYRSAVTDWERARYFERI